MRVTTVSGGSIPVLEGRASLCDALKNTDTAPIIEGDGMAVLPVSVRSYSPGMKLAEVAALDRADADSVAA